MRGLFFISVLSLVFFALLEGGCQQQRDLSGLELQQLKIETLKENEGELTETEELRIRSIQARTESDYNESVERVIAERRAATAR